MSCNTKVVDTEVRCILFLINDVIVTWFSAWFICMHCNVKICFHLSVTGKFRDFSTLYKLKYRYCNFAVQSHVELCSDEKLRSHLSNKLKLNKVRTELFWGTFWHSIPCQKCLIRTGYFSLSNFTKSCKRYYMKKNCNLVIVQATKHNNRK